MLRSAIVVDLPVRILELLLDEGEIVEADLRAWEQESLQKLYENELGLVEGQKRKCNTTDNWGEKHAK